MNEPEPGTVTSPVPRGAFVMDRLLGRPPEPPPEAVPAVEPDVRGATSIREQLALHRNNQACAGCHAKFDPAGFALESFDVIGGGLELRRLEERVQIPRDLRRLFVVGGNGGPDGNIEQGKSEQGSAGKARRNSSELHHNARNSLSHRGVGE